MQQALAQLEMTVPISHSGTLLPKQCAVSSGNTICSENWLYATLVLNRTFSVNSILSLKRYVWQIHVFVHTWVTPVPIFTPILSCSSNPHVIWLYWSLWRCDVLENPRGIQTVSSHLYLQHLLFLSVQTQLSCWYFTASTTPKKKKKNENST